MGSREHDEPSSQLGQAPAETVPVPLGAATVVAPPAEPIKEPPPWGGEDGFGY